MAPAGIFVAAKPQFNLSPDTSTVPDILVRPAVIKTPDLRGNDALLLVEIAGSSVSYDPGPKAPLDASHGTPKYWVINAQTLVTTVHLRPHGNAHAVTGRLSLTWRLVPSLAAALAVSRSELDLD